MTEKIFHGKVFLLITGASQGIGKKIAEVFGSSLDAHSHVLLLARNAENLKATTDLLPKNLNINYQSIDLAKTTAAELKEIIIGSIGSVDNLKTFNEAVIVHNVGTIGKVPTDTVDMTDFDEWRQYCDLNIFSPAVLNGVFMDLFKDKNIKIHVISITSLTAIKPMKSLGFYCSGKAAKEMFFKVFALENPDVNVLNYSPGPVKTDMLDTFQKSLPINIDDEKLNESVKELKDKYTVLTTDQTIKRLVEVLLRKKYKSGDHVDYFDEL